MDIERSARRPKPAAEHAASAFVANEATFRSITDAVPALVSLMTSSGGVESVNCHVLDYFGKTIEQLRDWAASDNVHPDDLPAVVAAWQGCIGTGTPYDIEHRCRRADGAYRWFHVRGQPVKDAHGRILSWCVLQVDIDERKRVELLSTGEKKVLEMVAAGQPLPLILEAICRLLDSVADGCSSGILLLDRSHTRVRHAIAPGLPASYNRALEGLSVGIEQGPCGMAATLKQQVIVQDIAAETRWNPGGWPALALAHDLRSCWSTPVLSVAGEALGAFAIYQRTAATPTPFHQGLIERLTHLASIAMERARTEEALRRSQLVLAEAEKLSATGSFSFEPRSALHWWSAQTYRIFGLPPSQVPSFHAMRQRVHPDDADAFDRGLQRVLRGDAVALDLRVIMPDGVSRYLQLEINAVNLDGESSEWVGAVRDVTERRLSEQALGKARAELAHVARVTTLGVLTASIAHEINQPLSGILTNASTCLRMLAAAPPNLEGARETTRRTLRDGNRAAEVISRLRALFGNEAATTEPVDLNDATREVLALLRSELQLGRVVLRTHFAEPLPPVTGDRVQLQQVILNLVLNAAAAMSGVDDRPRLLVIRTESTADCVRLSVEDAGAGIEPERAERLFEAFYTTKKDGMGIGLSVSRAIIEAHSGTLTAASNVGPGATFEFSIPRTPPAAAATTSPG
jgi:PAS domain S-box-containing protein